MVSNAAGFRRMIIGLSTWRPLAWTKTVLVERQGCKPTWNVLKSQQEPERLNRSLEMVGYKGGREKWG